MKRSIGLVFAAVVLLSSGIASAQVRAGLSESALRSELAGLGLEIRSITVPLEGSLPVRIALARAGGQEAVALLDVRVMGTCADARAWIALRSETASTHGLVARGPHAHADTAEGAAAILLTSRDNVALSVRSIDATLDAAAVASSVIAAIARSPIGGPGADRLAAPEVPRDLAVGASHAVQVPGGLLASRMLAIGDGYARRTPRGWMVTRTGTGEIAIAITGVDALFRFVH